MEQPSASAVVESVTIDNVQHLYVVSDLHLGGLDPSREVFCDDDALAWLVDTCSERAATESTVLCLAGDIIDFLLAVDAKYFDAERAPSTVEYVATKQVPNTCRALHDFVAKPNATLAILIGNHDLEFVRANIREAFVRHFVAPADDDARGRVRWVAEELRVPMSTRAVRVVHGNSSDDFNRLPWDVKVRFRDQSPSTAPNAGTRLVIDVINPIKLDYAFVDLLKPETTAVPTLLLALPTDVVPKPELVARVASCFVQSKIDTLPLSLRVITSWFGRSSDPQTRSSVRTLSALDRSADRNVDESEDAIREAAALLIEHDLPIEAIVQQKGTLRPQDFIVAKLQLKSDRDALRIGLQSFVKDQTFALSALSTDDRGIVRDARPQEILIAGHTHLARSTTVGNGTQYINTGTWMRLMRVESSMIDGASIDRFIRSVKTPDVRALDGNTDTHNQPSSPGGLAFRRRTYAYAANKKDPATNAIETSAELYEVTGGAEFTAKKASDETEQS